MKATQLIEVLSDVSVYGQLADIEIVAVVNDTRKVVPNSCFIAIKGEQFDGHSAMETVYNAGARLMVVEYLPEGWQDVPLVFIKVRSTFRAQAILANQFYQQPTRSLNVVAVTGTNGKTTTSSMISDLLMALGHKTGVIGTLHYKVDQTFYPAVNTTPNALELQDLFHQMVKAGCEDAVIEASSHALALGRLWYTDIDCAIYTNLTREHLDFHQTMDHYAYAKSLLFAQLGQRFYEERPRVAIINADDAYANVMIQSTAAEVLTYSTKQEATVYSTNIESQSGTQKFNLYYSGKKYSVSIPMSGEYNVSNYLAAFLCLVAHYRFTPEEVIGATATFQGVLGRMQAINEGQQFEAIVDFAHTPDAIRKVLAELRHHAKHLVTIIGHSGGNRDSGARPEIGDIVFEYSDEIIFTADNPRFESIDKICGELIGQHTEKPYIIIEDREEAIKYAIQNARSGDTLFFAGKGGEPYQIIGDEKIPFDEADLIRYYLKQFN